MTGCSMAAKRMGNDLITGKQKIGDISNSMKTATASTKALGVAMNVFANVGFMLAITAITKVVTELAQAQSKAVESAKEATEVYKDELSSLEDYKKKVTELHEKLNSENISYEDSKTIREELLVLQDELIKKYGNEKTAIENITTAIKGEVDALDELNEKSYRDWVAKVDETTFWNISGKSGLGQAIDYMENDQTVSFYDMQNANLSEELQAIQKEIDETIQSKYNLDKTFAMFNVTGTPEEIKSQLETIRQDYMDLSKEAFLENGISSELWEEYRKEALDSINEVINKFDEGLGKHQETYQTYIEGMIKYDSEYSDEYANILQKRAELEQAQASGDEETVLKARKAFMDAINDSITSSGSNENVKKYFASLYPELQEEFSDWNFEFAINANTDNLKGIATEIGEQYTAVDLLDMVNTEGIHAFNSLINKAIEYGVCTDNSAEEVQKLIDLLVELGYVQGEVYGQNPDETTIQLGISETIDELNTKLKPTMDSLADAWQNVFDDDGNFAQDNVNLDMFSSIKSELDSLNEEFGISVDGYEDLIKTLTDTETGTAEAKNAFDDFATSLFYGVTASGMFNDETKDTIVQMMESLGITNALEIANRQLAITEEGVVLAEQTKADAMSLLTETDREHIAITQSKIQAYLLEAGATDVARLATFQLIAAEQIFGNTDLNCSQKIQELNKLASAYLTTAQSARLAAYTKGLEKSGMSSDEVAQKSQEYINQMMNESVKIDVDYDGFINDAQNAGSKAGKSLADAMEEELNSLDSVISAVGGLIDDQIDHIQEQCDSVVDSLEKERDAILDNLEAEKKALEDAVEAKEKQIQAIKDAQEQRTAELNLQKEIYEFELLKNQRTKLIYSDAKGFHYETSTNELRDQKEKVDEAKEEIKILQIEKEISALEDSIEIIDEKIEEVNKHYDTLIEQTEAYYKSLIDGLEAYKSRWEELGELKEQAKFKQQLEELGLSSVDILNMSEEAFQAFKTQYVDALDKYLQATGEGLDAVADTDLTSTADSVSKVADATTKIDDEKVANLSSAMEGLGNTSNLEALYTVFSNLQTIIQDISDTLNGVDKEGGLVSALNNLGNIDGIGVAGDETNGLIGKFIALKNAINDVTTAISGGAEGQNLPQGGAPTMQGAMTPSGSPDSSGTGGLKQAIKEQVEEATTLLPEEIAKFAGEEDSLEGAVQKVITKVAGASGEESGQEGGKQQSDSGEADPTNLKGAIQAQYEKAEEVIVPLEVPMFEQLRDVILECVDGLNNMVTAMQSLSEVSLGGDMQFGLINFHSEGTVGKAFAKGTGKYKGLPHDEKNALRSEYGQPELTVYPDGTTELTNKPVMSDLPKGTVIFNEEQTRRIMNGNGEILGKAFANGTDISTIKTPTNLPPYLRELREGDRMYDLIQKMNSHNELIQSQIIPPVNSIQKNFETMTRNISNVNTNNVANNQTINMTVNCPGITSKEVANQVKAELNHAFFGMSNYAYQRASVTR